MANDRRSENKIRIIPEDLANKIAAGEVVERPASVVKELIENSLDAGATEINVELTDGGKRSIRIVDNGEGMSKEDAILSIERHATSKISSEEDLFSVTTLGFRGEALSSIASVSELDITTKRKGALSGVKLKVRNGSIQEAVDCGSPDGTAIDIKNLFYNTPARCKFLKTTSTELSHIVDTTTRYAISSPDVKFFLSHNGKTMLNLLKGRDFKTRISEALDKKVSKELVELQGESDGVTISGYISSYEYSLPNRKGQYAFVNGRWVRDRVISHAISEGCKPFFMKDRFPVLILFIDMVPSDVDVNVHPTKNEVRFKNSSNIHRLIYKTISNTLRSVSPITGVAVTEFADASERSNSVAAIREPVSLYSIPEQRIPEDFPLYEFSRAGQGGFETTKFSDLQIIGQLWDTYILCQSSESFILLDQHAAHERIAFERLQKEYFSSGMLKGHPLLMPQVIELSPGESIKLKDSIETFNKFGIEIDHFGGNDFAIKALPAILMDRDCISIIKNLLYELLPVGQGSAVKDAIDNILHSIACHSVIRGKRRLEKMEISELLKDLDSVGISSNCPHGRPVVKRFSLAEIERFFRR